MQPPTYTEKANPQDIKPSISTSGVRFIELTDKTVKHAEPVTVKPTSILARLLKFQRPIVLGKHQVRPSLAYLKFEKEDEKVVSKLEEITRVRNSCPELLSWMAVYYHIDTDSWILDMAYPSSTYQVYTEFPLQLNNRSVYTFNSRESFHPQGTLGDIFDIDPLTICTDAQARQVLEAFPYSKAVRIYKWGHVQVVYEDRSKLRRALKSKFPIMVSGMTWGLILAPKIPKAVQLGHELMGAEHEKILQHSGLLVLQHVPSLYNPGAGKVQASKLLVAGMVYTWKGDGKGIKRTTWAHQGRYSA
ncbi:MAG: hypothetical protein MMC33_008202 [Icmadophila ericetorum]|nr:hypothetical protein [Icmadophila ericetorum]